MQRKGIRGTWLSPAGLSLISEPTGLKLDRDLAIGRIDAGGTLLADSHMLSTDPILGAFTESPNNDPLAIVKFEAQLQRPIDLVTAFTDNVQLESNTFPFDVQWPGARKLIISQTLTEPGWNMATTAAGAHDAEYQQAVDNLVPWKERILAVRIGWEFNANGGYPWSIGGSGTNQSAANYALCFHRFALMFRKAMPGVLIDWCPLSDHTIPDAWYPGDDVVDIIGNDVYIKQAFHANSFDVSLAQTAGLLWQESFAQAHGKLMGYAEWATDYTDGSEWIRKMAEWMRRPRSAGRVLYQSYWNSDSVVSAALTNKPLNLAAYKAAFAEL